MKKQTLDVRFEDTPEVSIPLAESRRQPEPACWARSLWNWAFQNPA
jgi:hypothetical protein